MKMLAIMSLKEKCTAVRGLLEEHGVQIYSEMEILGRTPTTIAKYGWFATPQEHPEYSTLCFAILEDEAATAIFDELARISGEDTSDHPVRAFLVPVERMV
jgi:hypothetical protein